VGLTSEHVPLTAADARRELVRDIQEFLDSTLNQSIGLERIAHEFMPVAKHVDADVSRRYGRIHRELSITAARASCVASAEKARNRSAQMSVV
jgi:hypothetical protein